MANSTLLKAMWSFIIMFFQLSYSFDFFNKKKRERKNGGREGDNVPCMSTTADSKTSQIS